ncbi:chromate transporter [Pseudoroseomonas rhizosphaerae]|uniref:Chromate transporter n=1 Tax=Teichococcus rhizosphaerae TaxID=1335062 RepID=A0A2C7AGP3_9PROT|nr:chromate efflux transporter [Pseudoroseomonas rhizosphaerae]PHK96863.1 chromate transporter [Pseudoroseomonas rhizosphaerae]
MREEPRVFHPDLGVAARLWWRIGCLSFGGPAAQIALMHREVVEERRWVGEARFLHALNFCMLLPGPEAQQLATYLGWLMHGVRGGLLAGLLFILPGAAVMLALSFLYVTLGTVPAVEALFFGLQCAVLALVVEALVKVARRALHGVLAVALAIGAFLALFALDLPFPLVVGGAALLGAAFPAAFVTAGGGGAPAGPPALIDRLLAEDPERPHRMAHGARRAGLAMLALWAWPVALLMGTGLFGDIAWFFARMAVVTFGGAYAVLAYVAQEAVENYGWLSAEAMLAGLGLAETTPGPLILVLQFVGFLAGWQQGAGSAVAAALLTLWVTFAPCFAWIFLGAPFIERLHAMPRLRGALAAVTAAVVGVIANLAVWFALRLMFGELAPWRAGPFRLELPVLTSLDPAALGLSLLAAIALLGLRFGVAKVLALAALAGLALRMAGG